MLDAPVAPSRSLRARPLPLAPFVLALAVACGGDGATVVGAGVQPNQPTPQPVAELPPAEPATETNGTGLAAGEALPDAGSVCVEPACSSSCPAPRVDVVLASDRVWSRDPSSGACCSYDGRQAAPETWPFFDSEAACQNDCRCTDIQREGDFASERTSLECLCTSLSCPSSIEEAIDAACNTDFARDLQLPFVRTEGCGRTAIRAANGLAGVAWVFDSTSGALVGAVKFADTTNPPCNVYDTLAGEVLDCDTRVDCLLCGESRQNPPPPNCG